MTRFAPAWSPPAGVRSGAAFIMDTRLYEAAFELADQADLPRREEKARWRDGAEGWPAAAC